MKIQDIEQKVQQLSQESGIGQDEIFTDLSNYLQLKYGNNISANERAIIDGTKQKIMQKLYGLRDHTLVSKRPDFQQFFNLDKLELDYLKKVGEELEQEGLLEGNENYTKLTKNGILAVKKMNGEL